MAPLDALYLVTWANAAPVVAQLILREHWKMPVDGGTLFRDGRPWLGSSKTWRGWGICATTTPLVGIALGLSWEVGFITAFWAMVGDCAASFTKRRLGYRSGGPALLLDQVPESLLPALAIRKTLELDSADIFIVVGGFFLIHSALTPILLKLRRRPGSDYG